MIKTSFINRKNINTFRIHINSQFVNKPGILVILRAAILKPLCLDNSLNRSTFNIMELHAPTHQLLTEFSVAIETFQNAFIECHVTRA